MTQAESGRLVASKKAAEEIGVTERQVRRLLRTLRRPGAC